MIIAVDIGGTKTLVATFQEGAITNEERFETPQDPAVFVSTLERTLERFPVEQFEAISVAVPGLLAPDGTILRCGNLPWKNVHLKQMLAERYHCPIYQENDANLAGLAEAHALPQIPELALYVTISTGIGTGIIVRGRIDTALTNSEGGHMVLEHHGRLSTWESFASGSAIKRRFGRHASDITDPLDWQQIVNDLAAGFGALIPLLQPNVIIIGGGVGSHFDLFGQHLKDQLRQRLPEYIALPPIQQATHALEAVIYGCYYYATHQRTA